MKRIGLREFEDWIATEPEPEPWAIERNGQLIGYYIPVGQNRALDREFRRDEALARLETAIEQVLEQTGMTEDELADYFDLSKPLPELEPALHDRTPASQRG